MEQLIRTVAVVREKKELQFIAKIYKQVLLVSRVDIQKINTFTVESRKNVSRDCNHTLSIFFNS